ncbi:sensor histidine kinase [Desulfofundulus thermosubterraneus]|uniref:histidine kinase n=1 Tax=Desulfofundulus thermosubterraneus DSM 16057 TaxID=1121432 RepID=A0A1M6EAU4_9FIRM|nr:ATP-binding protein [Desulfofundulus thermosubterraneus]SHI82408.1 GAF domain-containing protein [Desulfofundulus thermosubterraneus DSM 16057]
MIDDKARLIENLTGVRSSKLNYYVELKKRNREIVIQNRRLEIIHQLSRDINIDMSLEMIVQRVYENLPPVIPSDFLGLITLEGSELRLVATQPPLPHSGLVVPRNSVLWEIIRKQQDQVYLCIAGEGKHLEELPVRQFELNCLILNPLKVKQNIIGMLVIGTREKNIYSQNDLTFARQLADQLAICVQNRRLYEEVVQAKREWEEAFRARVQMQAQLIQSAKLAAIGEMAAGVAHELNNPMTVILGNAQMLHRELGSGHPAFQLLQDIVTCGLRCKKIIQNLLTFARHDLPAVAPTDLNEVVERVLSLVKYQINRNGIKVQTDLAPDLPRVAANGQQLDQVLINLLLNARDALEGVERERYIRIGTGVRRGENGRRYVFAAVRDNGQGISPKNVSRVFDPFFTTKEASRGTGLGLSVSLGIARAHGGTIEVESRPGEGSVFTLVLPLEESWS